MKTMIAKGLLVGSIISLFIACNAKKQEPETVADQPAAPVVDKEQIKKEIQSKEDAFAEIFNSGQLREIGYYAEDAISYFQNRPPLVGKPAILSFLKEDITASSTRRIKFTTNEVFVSNDGNLVTEIGSFKVTDTTGNPINTGNYMCLFEKRNGKYYVVRDMSASDVPIQ